MRLDFSWSVVCIDFVFGGSVDVWRKIGLGVLSCLLYVFVLSELCCLCWSAIAWEESL